MRTSIARLLKCVARCGLVLFFCLQTSYGQTLSSDDRENGREMLRDVQKAIKENYDDKTFNGVDLDKAFKTADEKIRQATSNGQVYGIIAEAVRSLNDSHTFFVPPLRVLKVDYDWHILMIGDRCYISAVKPGSDAETKGLKPGDILHVVDGYKITRENFWEFNYLYEDLQPKTSLSVVVQSANEQPRKVEFNASTRRDNRSIDPSDLIRADLEDQRINPHAFKIFGDDLFVWKMPRFDQTEKQVNEFVKQANKTKSLILDLRGNHGGDEQTLLKLIGNLFDHDVKIGEIKSRSANEPFVAKTRGHDIFKGQLILLVDSGSSSAAELLARVVQIEKRGTIIGDQTAGSVGRARPYWFSLLHRPAVYYGVSITEASLIMTDGKSLEHSGLLPDKLMLPTGSDLRDGADPVLSYAASLVGVKLEPNEAGALFPIRWKVKP